MIGRIKEDRIFEFHDVNTDGFAKALDFWAHFNESDIAVVSDSSDKVKCIVFNEKFIVEPSGNDIQEGILYHIRVYKLSQKCRIEDIALPDKNEKLPDSMKRVKADSLKIFRSPVPKILE